MILIIIILICLGIYTNKIKNSVNEKHSINRDEEGSQKGEMNTISNKNERTEPKEEFEEAFVNYLVNSIKIYTQNESILKDTMGDVTASKLSIQEFEDKKEDYKKEIKSMLEDHSVISTKFIKTLSDFLGTELYGIIFHKQMRKQQPKHLSIRIM